MDASRDILNVLHLYAECMDSGDFAGAAALFEHADIEIGGGTTVDAAGLLQVWKSLVIVYPDGTPRTKHVITNAIVDVDEVGGSATCRSYYTIFQQLEDFPLQVIATGRYHDRFGRIEGNWRFVFRDYSLLDHIGDVSRHLTQLPTGQ
jgi:hypothetical protein